MFSCYPQENYGACYSVRAVLVLTEIRQGSVSMIHDPCDEMFELLCVSSFLGADNHQRVHVSRIIGSPLKTRKNFGPLPWPPVRDEGCTRSPS